MNFEWDVAKAAANIGKHGVSFVEAASALRDDFAATARDLDHSTAEFFDLLRSVSPFAGGCLPFHTRSAEGPSESSVRAQQLERKGRSMKKAKSEADDWLRAEYKRSDLGSIVRGKYVRRMASESNVVVLDPVVSKAFPNEASVNAALRGLLELAKASTRPTKRSTRTRAKATRAG